MLAVAFALGGLAGVILGIRVCIFLEETLRGRKPEDV